MKKLKFISYTLLLSLIVISHGVAAVTIQLNIPDDKFKNSVFKIHFPHMGSGWKGDLKDKKTVLPWSVCPSLCQDANIIYTPGDGVKKEYTIPCYPRNFTSENSIISVEYHQYGSKTNDGLTCKVTGAPAS